VADFPVVDLTYSNSATGERLEFVTAERHARVVEDLANATHDADELARSLDDIATMITPWAGPLHAEQGTSTAMRVAAVVDKLYAVTRERDALALKLGSVEGTLAAALNTTSAAVRDDPASYVQQLAGLAQVRGEELDDKRPTLQDYARQLDEAQADARELREQLRRMGARLRVARDALDPMREPPDIVSDAEIVGMPATALTPPRYVKKSATCPVHGDSDPDAVRCCVQQVITATRA
jgi:hypothetical protein